MVFVKKREAERGGPNSRTQCKSFLTGSFLALLIRFFSFHTANLRSVKGQNISLDVAAAVLLCFSVYASAALCLSACQTETLYQISVD